MLLNEIVTRETGSVDVGLDYPFSILGNDPPTPHSMASSTQHWISFNGRATAACTIGSLETAIDARSLLSIKRSPRAAAPVELAGPVQWTLDLCLIGKTSASFYSQMSGVRIQRTLPDMAQLCRSMRVYYMYIYAFFFFHLAKINRGHWIPYR